MELTGSANRLEPGVQIREYHLQGVLGEGGFGIVYRAYDVDLDRTVAIKEYMPCALASRAVSRHIQVIPQHREAFDAGLRSFVNEARLLARFSHPALVHVYRFFEENGTAYMVMRYYEGQTFRAYLIEHQDSMDERWLKSMLSPILDGLEMLHAADCYHRDIAPDNVFLSASGMPVLLDFGAARRIIGDMTQALTTVLKPGFAPIEQYADDGAMPQGAWTDIYQLGAMLYRAITGKVPATSVARMIRDPIRELTPAQYPGYSEQFLRGVYQALSVRPADRPQSISEFKSLLGVEGFTASAYSAWSASDVGPLDALAKAQDVTVPDPRLASSPHRLAPNAQADIAEATTVWFARPLINTPDEEPMTLPAPRENRAGGSAQTNERPEPATQPLLLPNSAVFTATEPAAGQARGQGLWQPPVVQDISVQPTHVPTEPTASSNHATIFWKLAALTTAAMLLLAGIWYLFGVRPPPGKPQALPLPQLVQQQSWDAAQKAGTVASLQAYLAAYPEGEHAAEARAKLASLMTPPAPPVVPDKPTEPTVKPDSAPSAAEVTIKPNVAAPTAPSPDSRADAPVKPTPAAPTANANAPANANAASSPVVTRPRPEVTKPDGPPVTLSDNKPAAPVETGTVTLKITPWGHVRVNRSPVGSSPPLTQLNLPEGQYQIEISNPNGASVTKQVQVIKGEAVVLSHKFE